jgi:putative ABC transport system permease protein
MLDRFTHAFRQGVRAVQSSPGLSAIVVTTLAVTIAASVTGYSVLSATLFKALPFHEPDRVVSLRHSYSDSGGAASPPLFVDYRRGARTFQSLSAAMPWTANLTGSGDPEHLNGLLVSATFFETLGVTAARGRTFTPEEEQPGRDRVVLLSDGFWKRRFGGRGPHRWREIVGVVADVHDRRIDRTPGPQIYVPYAQRATGGLFLVTRTAVPPLDTVAELRAAVKAVDPDLPVYGITTLETLATNTTTDRRVVRTALTGFATAAVLLVALGLYGLLAQVVRERVQEIGVRMALGATPAAVMRLFLREGGQLVIQGLCIGVVASLAATRLLQGLVFGVTTMDPLTYVTVAALLSAISGAACLFPAWRAAKHDPLIALRME